MKASAPEPQGIPAGLLASSKARSSEVVAKLQKAMRDMELEIEQNDGLYPLNGGRVSAAEVCRRAGVNPITLHAPAHKETTRKVVETWVEEVVSKAVQGVKRIRRTVTDRADAWKQAHDEIATAYHIDHLVVVNLKAALREAEKQIKTLEDTNAALVSQLDKLSSSNVKSLPKRKK